jgi:hypothetical protein
MSILWLDTELEEEHHLYIAEAVRRSGLSRAELEDVFELELAPFLGPNHLQIAGEWDEFPPDWVCEMAERQRRKSRLWPRFLAKTGLSTYAARPDWESVKSIVFDSSSNKVD